MLIDFMNDHDLEQLVQFPAWEKKYIGFYSYFSFCLPGQFEEIHALDLDQNG